MMRITQRPQMTDMALRDYIPFRLHAPTGAMMTLGTIAVASGLVLSTLGVPRRVPGEAELVPVSGRVATVAKLDDWSGAPIGDAAPGMTSINVTLEGLAERFRYPAGHPRYFQVYESLVGEVTLWVEAIPLAQGEPRTIWAIETSGLTVGRDEVAATLERTGTGNARSGGWLMLLGGSLLVAGWLGSGWNARRPDPSPAAIERARHGRAIVLGWFLDVAIALERCYDRGERVSGAVLGGPIGRGLWHAFWAGAFAIGLIALGAWLY
jgi:hypothetical protein